MADILSSPWFQTAGVPLLFLLVGVFAKRLARPDGDASPAVNDYALGPTILVGLVGAILTDTRGVVSPEHVDAQLGWLSVVLSLLFVFIHDERYYSWRRTVDGVPGREKKLLRGVLLPDLCALVVFALYQWQKLVELGLGVSA